MTYDLLFALFTFAVASICTPGPNNLMLIASGANFGFRRSVPHMMGIALGLPVMIILLGMGIFQLFEAWPVAMIVLKVLSVLYMLFLAWKIANAQPPKTATKSSHPFTFMQAAGFQWVNPKAWTMSLGAITLYASGQEWGAILWIAGVFATVGIFSTAAWTSVGQKIGQFLQNPTRLRWFNWSMAVLLVASLIPVLFMQ